MSDKLLNEVRESQVRTETLLKEYLPRVRSAEEKAGYAYAYVKTQSRWAKRGASGALALAVASLMKYWFG